MPRSPEEISAEMSPTVTNCSVKKGGGIILTTELSSMVRIAGFHRCPPPLPLHPALLSHFPKKNRSHQRQGRPYPTAATSVRQLVVHRSPDCQQHEAVFPKPRCLVRMRAACDSSGRAGFHHDELCRHRLHRGAGDGLHLRRVCPFGGRRPRSRLVKPHWGRCIVSFN